MEECDILGVKTYSDPSYVFSGGQDPQPTWFTSPLYITWTDNRKQTIIIATTTDVTAIITDFGLCLIGLFF